MKLSSEASGVKALEEIGISARHDLDPILMVDKKYWFEIMDRNQIKKKPYILLYLVEENSELISQVKKFAKKNNMDIMMIAQGLKPIQGVNIKRFVSVGRWISYMNSAELIVTNSYHALSFAIALEKNFRLVKLNKILESNTRMLGLLNELELGEYVADKMETLGVDEPNWKNVNSILSKRRINSFSYLASIFNKSFLTDRKDIIK